MYIIVTYLGIALNVITRRLDLNIKTTEYLYFFKM